MKVAILAGGKSKRFGFDKALLVWRGKPIVKVLFERFETNGFQVIVSGGPEEAAKRLKGIISPIVSDLPAHAGFGPLAGIESCFLNTDSKLLGVVACDLPFAEPKLISFLAEKIKGADAAVPLLNGEPQPLHAVYSRSCLPNLVAQLESEDKSVRSFLKRVKVVWVEETEFQQVAEISCLKVHLNRLEDLERWDAFQTVSVFTYSVPLVISFVGFSGSGKTTIIERLLHGLSKKGYNIGVIKHHHGQIDAPCKDTWRHRQAGATIVALVAADGIALFPANMDLTSEQTVDFVRKLCEAKPLHLILLEGFKSSEFPKIVVLPKGLPETETKQLWFNLEAELGDIQSVIGIVGGKNLDSKILPTIPRFEHDDLDKIVAFVEGALKVNGFVSDKGSSARQEPRHPVTKRRWHGEAKKRR